ncbi:ATPase GET3C-like [Primulina tabacum]|uniref:ATPase GET3C-like n=1 Tax=Primulina tabacum TaxID=48773 RepID=UPI003F5A2AB2
MDFSFMVFAQVRYNYHKRGYDTPSRLCASLLKEKVPVRRLVNQLLPQSASDCKFCAMKTKDQNPVLDMIPKDPELAKLALIRSHLMDLEIRGIPALKFMGDMVRR